MPKKRKLNSKNPKYNPGLNDGEDKKIKKKVLMCEGPNEHTDVRFKVYGVWYENDQTNKNIRSTTLTISNSI